MPLLRKYFLLVVLTVLVGAPTRALANNSDVSTGYDLLGVVDEYGDTIPFVMLPNYFIYPKLDAKREKIYWKIVRDVKKTLPYAKQIAAEVKNVDEKTASMSERQRKSYMKDHEDDLVDKFKPALKKLSLRQGKILIKLVDRQCGHSSYELIKDYRGGFRAVFWQGFAKMLGADLKANYNKDEEKLIERAINLVESGQV